jgi:hypothetical protein
MLQRVLSNWRSSSELEVLFGVIVVSVSEIQTNVDNSLGFSAEWHFPSVFQYDRKWTERSIDAAFASMWWFASNPTFAFSTHKRRDHEDISSEILQRLIKVR